MKYSLRVLVMIVFFAITSPYSYAQSTGNQEEIELAASNKVHANVGGVNIQFCNSDNKYRNKNNLTLEIEPGSSQDICMEFINEFDYDIDLKVNFIDGGMTNDAVNPKRSCQNEDSKEYFGQFVEKNEEIINIPAGTNIRLIKTLKLPASQIGYNYGCVTYSIPKQKSTVQKTGIGYDVLIRKAGLIDIKVKGELQSILELVNFTTQGRETITGDIIRGPLLIDSYPNYLDVYTTIKNPGTVPQKVKAKGIIEDIFGRATTLYGTELVLAPNEEKTIHLSAPKDKRWYFNYFGRNPSISRYRGSYKGYVKLEYSPYLPQGTIDADLIGGSYNLGGGIFLMPWRLVILLALIISRIVYTMIKAKKKKKKEKEEEQQEIGDQEIPNEAPSERPNDR